MRQKVTAIVPAYNEEKHIENVLQVLVNSDYTNEVICVNDGSTDRTAQIVKNIKGVKLLNLSKNHGKAYAIAQGIHHATGDIVVLIDADIAGLTSKACGQLVMPLVKEGYNVVIGYRSNNIEKTVFKPLTGERTYFKEDLLPHLNTLKRKGYGLELYLNYIFRNKKIKFVTLEDVKHIFKYKKRSPRVALQQETLTWRQILSEIAKQKNPATFFYYAYLANFYIKKK